MATVPGRAGFEELRRSTRSNLGRLPVRYPAVEPRADMEFASREEVAIATPAANSTVLPEDGGECEFGSGTEFYVHEDESAEAYVRIRSFMHTSTKKTSKTDQDEIDESHARFSSKTPPPTHRVTPHVPPYEIRGRRRAEHTFVPEVYVQRRMCSRSTHEAAPLETRRPTHGTPTRLEVRDGCMDFEPEIGAESRVQQSIATDAIIGAIREELNTRDTLYRQEIQSLTAEISALHLQAHARTSQTSSPLIKKESGEEKGEEISESPSRTMRRPKKENEETAIEVSQEQFAGLLEKVYGQRKETISDILLQGNHWRARSCQVFRAIPRSGQYFLNSFERRLQNADFHRPKIWRGSERPSRGRQRTRFHRYCRSLET